MTLMTRNRKIAVLGSRAVGKTSVVTRFMENRFPDYYDPTIEHTFQKSLDYKGCHYDLEVMDTAGHDEFSFLNTKHVLGIHGYLLVYSITSKSSFDMIKIIHDKILNHTGVAQVPLVLVGNKKDLGEAARQVTSAMAEEQARVWGCAWVETSAKQNENIRAIFEAMLNEMNRVDEPLMEKKGNMCQLM